MSQTKRKFTETEREIRSPKFIFWDPIFLRNHLRWFILLRHRLKKEIFLVEGFARMSTYPPFRSFSRRIWQALGRTSLGARRGSHQQGASSWQAFCETDGFHARRGCLWSATWVVGSLSSASLKHGRFKREQDSWSQRGSWTREGASHRRFSKPKTDGFRCEENLLSSSRADWRMRPGENYPASLVGLSSGKRIISACVDRRSCVPVSSLITNY